MMIWNAPKWLVIRDGSLLGWWFHENNILAPQMDLAFAAALEMTSVRWNLDMQQHSEKSRLPWCWSEWQKEWMNEWMWWNVMECDGMWWNGMEWNGMNEWMNKQHQQHQQHQEYKQQLQSSWWALILVLLLPPCPAGGVGLEQAVLKSTNASRWELREISSSLNKPECTLQYFYCTSCDWFLGFFTCFTTFFQRCSGVFLSNHPRRFYSDF